MAGVPFSELAQCPNCGAAVREDLASCLACGAPLSGVGSVSSNALQEEMKQLVETVNQNLMKAGSGAAEYAFGLGCSLGLILTTLILVVLLILGVRNWILLGIVALGGTLITTGTSAFLSSRARNATLGTTYDRTVKRQIDGFMQSHRISRLHLDTLADELLAEDAPLRQYLFLPETQEPQLNKE